MLKSLFQIAFLLMFVSGCATTVEPYDYTALKESAPRSILVIPPMNNSVEVTAPYSFLSTITAPLAESGYYVYPVSVIDSFLKENGLASERIDAISKMILSTEMGVAPVSEFEKILNDADCSHLGSKNFSYLTELLRREWELSKDRVLNESDWLSENIDFLTNKHRYYTSAASKIWDKQKSKNLAQLIKTEKKIKAEATKFKHKKEELAHKKSKIELPERGVETMFRVALRNHITLSDIADTKANILLSVNAIIISLALSNLIPKLDNPSNTYLIYPTVIFIVFSVISMVLAVLATRPNVTSGQFTKEDVKDKKVNLLFFGNFHKMKLDEYEWAINELVKDKEYIYSSLTKDLYFLGLVLNRKYKILRWTYTIFMIGMVVSVIAFAISFKFFGPDRAAELLS